MGLIAFLSLLIRIFFGQDTFTDAPVIYRLVWKKQLSTFAIEFSII